MEESDDLFEVSDDGIDINKEDEGDHVIDKLKSKV